MTTAGRVAVALVLLAGCSGGGGGGGSSPEPGDVIRTEYGAATVEVDGSLSFPDCTDAMRAAGGGRLTGFDPVADAGIDPPAGGGEWSWTCG